MNQGVLYQDAAKYYPEISHLVTDYADGYLNGYGYYSNSRSVKGAVRSFQKMYGLKQTGVISPETFRVMKQDRCGCPDFSDHDEQFDRMIQYIKSSQTQSRWKKTGLTYFVANYTPRALTKTAQEHIITRKNAEWSAACALNFTKASTANRADVLIDIGRGPRDDFDGPGGVLAWAYMPNGSDRQLMLKFDMDELFVDEPTNGGIFFDAVYAHELGHIAGLLHSKDKRDLLFAMYNPNIRSVQPGDAKRVLQLYGPSTEPTPSPTPSTPTRRIVNMINVYNNGDVELINT